MRTSRASKDTAKALQSLSNPRRQTRSNTSVNTALRSFAYDADTSVKTESPIVKTESIISEFQRPVSDDESSLSSVSTADIEDLIEPRVKRQKRSTSPSVLHAVKEEEKEVKPKTARTRRMPARKTRDVDGAVVVEPPSDWEVMYNTVKRMRADNPTAPVDTMGCAELYWRPSGPKDRRFQTLIALMLSSQTKDTVTAVAMQRLHTELGQSIKAEDGIKTEGEIKAEDEIKLEDVVESHIKSEDGVTIKSKDSEKDSTLNLKNILAVDPTRLNELIRTVGFHNNKTKYIKSAALILRDQFNGDIPSTPEGLMSLPGVGPKMAYLCMSAAWGKDLGIGVDVHVHRITNLWGWNKTKNPEETRLALQSWLPRDKWHEINKLLVGLGQTVCLPVKRRCGECYLAGTKLCKSEVKGLAVVKPDPLAEAKVKIEIS
ncbi:hypothetical protein N7495_007578 [Penicillium taxi]|uniref:uncharacterized protein n=1 Tax=Penicillium taxi TaxID=168475 RepID=UPI0025459819|nr:uncharacterized protein N7495_007578 [Penicillium taxi]KAJ5887537.1 hypothetical protein N7495_007578 [Penicillium taxi]